MSAFLSIPISFQKAKIKSGINLRSHDITSKSFMIILVGNNPTLNLDLSSDSKIACLMKNQELSGYKKIFNRLENEKNKQLDEVMI
jgi:hypothetical protein